MARSNGVDEKTDRSRGPTPLHRLISACPLLPPWLASSWGACPRRSIFFQESDRSPGWAATEAAWPASHGSSGALVLSGWSCWPTRPVVALWVSCLRQGPGSVFRPSARWLSLVCLPAGGWLTLGARGQQPVVGRLLIRHVLQAGSKRQGIIRTSAPRRRRVESASCSRRRLLFTVVALPLPLRTFHAVAICGSEVSSGLFDMERGREGVQGWVQGVVVSSAERPTPSRSRFRWPVKRSDDGCACMSLSQIQPPTL